LQSFSRVCWLVKIVRVLPTHRGWIRQRALSGTGHAPVTPPGGINGPHFNGRPGGGPSRGVFGNPIPANHPQHQRTVVVPYPVYYGGYSGYGYDPSGGYPPDQVAPTYSNGAPSVVINQNYIPPQANPSVQN